VLSRCTFAGVSAPPLFNGVRWSISGIWLQVRCGYCIHLGIGPKAHDITLQGLVPVLRAAVQKRQTWTTDLCELSTLPEPGVDGAPPGGDAHMVCSVA
jgi:hypothetical protein